MKRPLTTFISVTSLLLFFATSNAAETKPKQSELGTPENPIIISLLPERVLVGTNAKDLPLPKFLTPSRQQLSFKLILSDSYSKAVDDFCNSRVHLAVLSMVTYAELKKRCDIEELLAIEILEGQSVYHSGIFTHRKNFIKNNRQRSFHSLGRKTIAFGSPYSTTSFHYPLKLLVDLDVQLPDELDKVYMTGSHSAAIEKLARGEVELAAASFQSWKAAIDEGTIDPMQYMPLLKSGSIPLPPLIMNRFLPDNTKALIKQLFKEAHTVEDSDFIVGIRGRKINRYDVETVTQESYLTSLRDFESVELALIEQVKNKADTNDSK